MYVFKQKLSSTCKRAPLKTYNTDNASSGASQTAKKTVTVQRSSARICQKENGTLLPLDPKQRQQLPGHYILHISLSGISPPPSPAHNTEAHRVRLRFRLRLRADAVVWCTARVAMRYIGETRVCVCVGGYTLGERPHRLFEIEPRQCAAARRDV